jgi:hypothetical protein
MHIGRKAIVIATRSRRGIPLHWNERFQDKHFEKTSVSLRREYNRRNRRNTKQNIRAFYGVDWEDFISLHSKNCVTKYDWET